MAGALWSGLGKLFDAGAAYLQHVQLVQRALAGSPQNAAAELSQYVRGLSDMSFAGFKVTLAMLCKQATDAARRERLTQFLQWADAVRQGQAIAAPQLGTSRPDSDEDDFDAALEIVGSWYDLNDDGRKDALIEHVSRLSASGYARFKGHLRQMIANCEENIRNHKANEQNAWGGFMEDRIAYGMAKLQTGQRDPRWTRQLEQYQRSQQYFEWLVRASETVWAERERLAAAASSSTGAPAGGAARASGRDVATMLDAVGKFTTSGEYPGGPDQLKADIAALTLAGHGDEVMKLLEAAGATEGGNKPLNAGDYYRPGDDPYEVHWPIQVPLPVPFSELPRDVQFTVLFGEWTRRDMEGAYAMRDGDNDGARAIYEECLARAEQLAVPELVARSHEGFARVAEKTNQRSVQRKHLKLALAARNG